MNTSLCSAQHLRKVQRLADTSRTKYDEALADCAKAKECAIKAAKETHSAESLERMYLAISENNGSKDLEEENTDPDAEHMDNNRRHIIIGYVKKLIIATRKIDNNLKKEIKSKERLAEVEDLCESERGRLNEITQALEDYRKQLELTQQMRRELQDDLASVEKEWEDGLERDIQARDQEVLKMESIEEGKEALEKTIEETEATIKDFGEEIKKAQKIKLNASNEIKQAEKSLQLASNRNVAARGRLGQASLELKNSKIPPVSPQAVQLALDNLQAAEKVRTEALQEFTNAEKEVAIAIARLESEEKRIRQICDTKARVSKLLMEYQGKEQKLDKMLEAHKLVEGEKSVLRTLEAERKEKEKATLNSAATLPPMPPPRAPPKSANEQEDEALLSWSAACLKAEEQVRACKSRRTSHIVFLIRSACRSTKLT